MTEKISCYYQGSGLVGLGLELVGLALLGSVLVRLARVQRAAGLVCGVLPDHYQIFQQLWVLKVRPGRLGTLVLE